MKVCILKKESNEIFENEYKKMRKCCRNATKKMLRQMRNSERKKQVRTGFLKERIMKQSLTDKFQMAGFI